MVVGTLRELMIQEGGKLFRSNKNIPEFGGRIQIPVPRGEAAFSYHHRTADNRGMLDI